MTAPLAFRVVGIAQSMGSKKAYIPKGWKRPIITDSNKNLRAWQHLVAQAAGEAITQRGHWRLLDGPIRLSLAFFLPRPASLPKKVIAHTKAIDLDKAIRAVGDALSGIVYRDDSQVCEIIAGKYYAQAGHVPYCDVRVEGTEGRAAIEWSAAPSPLFQEPLFHAEGV